METSDSWALGLASLAALSFVILTALLARDQYGIRPAVSVSLLGAMKPSRC